MPLIEICMNCDTRMKVDQVGITALEYEDKEMKIPYTIWRCDTVHCPKCGYTAATRFADKGLRHFEPGFADELKQIEIDPATIRFY
jgi:hypothetical protein